MEMVFDEQTLYGMHKHVLVILDDVAGDIKHHEYDSALTKLFFNRRHLVANGTVSIITVTQKFTAIPQKIRVNCNWLIVFRLNPIEFESVWKDSIVLDRTIWKQVLSMVFGDDTAIPKEQDVAELTQKKYDNLGIWTEYSAMFFANFKRLRL